MDLQDARDDVIVAAAAAGSSIAATLLLRRGFGADPSILVLILPIVVYLLYLVIGDAVPSDRLSGPLPWSLLAILVGGAVVIWSIV